MQIKVNGEQKFSAKKDQFAVAPTTSGYQVAYSADGENFTLDADAVVPEMRTLSILVQCSTPITSWLVIPTRK